MGDINMRTHYASFYVGSTDTFNAHEDATPMFGFANRGRDVFGVWEGKDEATVIGVLAIDDKAHAIDEAANMARRSGNDCVLVVFPAYLAADSERVSTVINGDVDESKPYTTDGEDRWQFVPDPAGDYGALLVYPDGSTDTL